MKRRVWKQSKYGEPELFNLGEKLVFGAAIVVLFLICFII